LEPGRQTAVAGSSDLVLSGQARVVKASEPLPSDPQSHHAEVNVLRRVGICARQALAYFCL
jgi:hypothetical protein